MTKENNIEEKKKYQIARSFADSFFFSDKEPSRERFVELMMQALTQHEEEVAQNFHKVWIDKFGYEVVLWNKEQGQPISCHSVIKEALTPKQ